MNGVVIENMQVSKAMMFQCKRAAEAISKIIEEGLTQPDSENQLRRDQLMELAQLNGTIRDMGLR